MEKLNDFQQRLVVNSFDLVAQAKMYILAKHRMPGKLDKNDLESELALGLIKASQVYDPQKSKTDFRSYAWRTLMNAWTSKIRKERRRKEDCFSDCPMTYEGQSFVTIIPDCRPGPEDEAVLIEAVEQLEKSLGTLSERKRLVVKLRKLLEWKHQRIASLVGLSRSRVINLETEALQELRS